METKATVFEEVRTVVISALGVSDRAALSDPSAALLGSLPELDSMAVLQLVYALEERFGIAVGDDEVTGELFETLGSLTAFVEEKMKRDALDPYR